MTREPTAEALNNAADGAADVPAREDRSHTESRFLQKIRVTDTGCWEWTRSCKESGHGQFAYDGSTPSAHRVAYLLFANDDLPEDEVVRHRCPELSDTCCNPAHLTPGTQRDNLEDAFRDGTMAAQFTADDIREIRRRYHHNDKLTFTDLAEEIGVSITHISYIVKRDAYAYVEDDLPEDLAPGKGRDGYLTDDDVREIHERYRTEEISHADLAEDYPVGRSMIGRILRGERHGDVN